MSEESRTASKEPSTNTYLIVMLASLASTVVISAIFLFFVPIEPWLAYLVVGAVWISEFIALGIIYSLYRKAAKPNSSFLVWSGFGEQRPNIGSQSPTRRR